MRLDASRALCCSATLLGLVLAFHAAPARAERVLTRQRPVLRSPGRLPLGVPSGYMLTRGGFFHPSCVVTLHDDETVGEDRVIRGLDGRAHARLTPCAQPRFNAAGALLPSLASLAPTPVAPDLTLKAAPVHAPAYDGWIISFFYSGSVKPGKTVKLSTDVIVPSPPLKVSAQDVAFFNDIETSTKGGDILQPVLDFGGYGKNWAIESEHCCVDNNDLQSDPVQVAPGDLIRGVVTGINCDAKGACASWTIVTTDVTSGDKTTLNTNIATGAINEINPAVLETYDVGSCDMLPANGEITYFNHHLTNADGQDLPLSYDFVKDNPMTTTFPTTCGYRGEQAGGSYTLIFGKNPSSVGGANAGGAAGDAAGGASGGAGGTSGGAGGTSGGAGGVSAAGTGGVMADAGGVAGSVAAAGLDAAAGGAVTSASAGSAGTVNGAPSVAGSAGSAGNAFNAGSAGAASVAHEPGADSAGCSCRVAAPPRSFRFAPWLGLLGLAQVLRVRRRHAR